ncbi:DUF2793 domain-containing protein [Hyphomicrobium facile]|uniref:DUF2793 domain-containing protein n=1 Tax=Hyphomicrobium facile TaxID=51670 RepID=A0A1I7NFR0_9HYPH|nr:DUF2793 domain-containing protein [Hyphomicrobium facile]SFV33504.1 Protein of unknown function [Hyphomicrobium facile]
MNDTPNLALPYILAAQAQKHVTHNEAIRALDCLVQLSVESRALTAPPSAPTNGDRFLIAVSPTGAWSGHAGEIAAFQDGAWAFYRPKDGWIAWVADESALVIYDAGAWSLFAGSGGGSGLTGPVANADLANVSSGTIKGRASAGSGSPEDLSAAQATALLDVFTGSGASHKKGLVPTPGATAGTAKYLREDGTWQDLSNVPLVGVNATADATNKLAIKSAASLFDNAGNGHQQKINKAAASDTASQLYQTNYSGRAEIGLTGDDDFHFKVSADGSTWREAIKIDRNTGKVSFPQSGGPREVLTAGRSYYVRTDGSDSNTGLANTTGGAFLTIQKAYDVIKTLDLNGFTVAIRVADGTYTTGLLIAAPPVGGLVTLVGNASSPGNCIISTTSASAIRVTVPITLTVNGFKLETTTSGNCIAAENGAAITHSNMEFGACAGGHMVASNYSSIGTATDYAISGGANQHVSLNGSTANIAARTLTLSGTLAFTTFIVSQRNSYANVFSLVFAGTYTATGKRYDANDHGVLNTGGGGASYFPGSTAGTGTNAGNSPYGLYK